MLPALFALDAARPPADERALFFVFFFS